MESTSNWHSIPIRKNGRRTSIYPRAAKKELGSSPSSSLLKTEHGVLFRCALVLTPRHHKAKPQRYYPSARIREPYVSNLMPVLTCHVCQHLPRGVKKSSFRHHSS